MIHVFGAPGPPVSRLVAALEARGHARRAASEAASVAGTDRGAGTSTLVLGDGGALDPLALGVLMGGWRKAPGARLLVVSALGAHPDARAPRLRRLWALEELARGLALPTLVVRLAPLVGPASPMWKRLRAGLALPDGGRALLEPVAEDDVVEALDRALTGACAWEGWHELVGPEPLTLAELAALARAHGGATRDGDGGAFEPAPEELREHRLAGCERWSAHFGVAPRAIAREAAAWAA